MKDKYKDVLESYEYLTVDQMLELPMFRHLKATTLAKWRHKGIGPPSVTVGRKPLYPPKGISVYMLELEKKQNEHTREIRALALPIQAKRRSVRKNHRLGG